jgi:uncharacterized protein
MKTRLSSLFIVGATALTLVSPSPAQPVANPSLVKLEPFDYHGVRLLESRWLTQFTSARDYYLSVSDDDILCGYRTAAGLPAPGHTLGGWCAKNSDEIFGQWLSGMARIYAATGDVALRDKAAHLVAEWAKTIGAGGDCRMDLYAYDKLVCGLVDQHFYAQNPDALPLLKQTLAWVMRTFPTRRQEATPDDINGQPHEWYTFAENLYRAYEVAGDAKIKAFADTYLDHEFWNKFAASSTPQDFAEVHAYSHVNTFSSVAMAYAVTGEERYLDILRHAYDFMQDTQCYATGGYGPMERLLPADGTLGRSLEARNASFETVCGSWAGFKMTRYLQEFTGEARYGDWMERLFYNGVGAALPITTGGKSFYYSDYRVTGGMKVYKVSRYSCCSGTYIQCVADYHNLIYYHTPSSLNVNLYVPSEVTWQGPAGDVHVVQTTSYPETETSNLSLTMAQPTRFALKFRVPAWADGFSARVNGRETAVVARPGTWAAIERTWSTGDTVEIRIPLKLRMVPVDPQHPRRVAVVRGPVVLVMDDWVFEEIPRLPEPKDLDRWLVPDEQRAGVFRIAPQGGKELQARFRPFYAIGEVTPYRIYHDLDAAPIPVW